MRFDKVCPDFYMSDRHRCEECEECKRLNTPLQKRLDEQEPSQDALEEAWWDSAFSREEDFNDR